jgi:hypothetical protein
LGARENCEYLCQQIIKGFTVMYFFFLQTLIHERPDIILGMRGFETSIRKCRFTYILFYPISFFQNITNLFHCKICLTINIIKFGQAHIARSTEFMNKLVLFDKLYNEPMSSVQYIRISLSQYELHM